MELERIQRAEKSSSVASVGEPRDSESIETERQPSPLLLFHREPMEIGAKVTWTGDLQNIRTADGAAFLELVQHSTGVGRPFGAFTQEEDFLDKIVDYTSAREAPSGGNGDRISVTGLVRAANAIPVDDRHIIQYGLLEIVELYRVNEPDSLVRVGQVRDFGPTGPKRMLTKLATIMRQRPSAGTEITLNATFNNFAGHIPGVRLSGS